MSCCPATASSKSKSCNQPVIARFNASLSFRPMRLRRFTVCGLQNSPENRYCNVIIFVLRICSLLLAGCINSRRKRKDSIQAWGIQEDLLRNQITSMNLILLLKALSPNTFKLLLIFIRVYHDWILSCFIPALAGFCNADCTSSGSLDKSNLNLILNECEVC